MLVKTYVDVKETLLTKEEFQALRTPPVVEAVQEAASKPSLGYDDLTVNEVVELLEDGELDFDAVREYEASNKDRVTIANWFVAQDAEAEAEE